jgi:threonine aldolase
LIASPTTQQFFTLQNEVIDRLMRTSTFEIWGTRGKTHSTVRFVTSWATKQEAVEQLIAEL